MSEHLDRLERAAEFRARVARIADAGPAMLAVLKDIDRLSRGSRGRGPKCYSFLFDSPIGKALRVVIAKADGLDE